MATKTTTASTMLHGFVVVVVVFVVEFVVVAFATDTALVVVVVVVEQWPVCLWRRKTVEVRADERDGRSIVAMTVARGRAAEHAGDKAAGGRRTHGRYALALECARHPRLEHQRGQKVALNGHEVGLEEERLRGESRRNGTGSGVGRAEPLDRFGVRETGELGVGEARDNADAARGGQRWLHKTRVKAHRHVDVNKRLVLFQDFLFMRFS